MTLFLKLLAKVHLLNVNHCYNLAAFISHKN
jgi:hypothetical protein